MKNFNVDFEEVVYIMGLASAAKVKACITSVEWNQTAVSDALTKADLGVSAIMSVSNHEELESVSFDCVARFDANEVPGIIAPFACNMQIEASLDKSSGKYHFTVFHGPKCMASASDMDACYNVEWLYHLFYKQEPLLEISDFISQDFNCALLCKTYGEYGDEFNVLSYPLFD